MKTLFAGCCTGLLLIGSMIGCGKWDAQPARTLTAIAVTPANPSIPKGLTQQFTATGTYSDGTSAPLTSSVTWTSAIPATATIVSATGLATGVVAGTSVITATSAGIAGNTTLTVTAATLVSIVVTPPTPTVHATYTQQFKATGHYTDLTTQVLTSSVVWTSATPAKATMNPNGLATSGLATGLVAGTSLITATSGAVSGNTLLTVDAGTLTSIIVTPANPTILVAGTQQFVATGNFTLAPSLVLTSSVVWSSASTSIATMNPSLLPSSGRATGLAIGTSIITATKGLISGNTLLTVGTLVPPPSGHLGSAATYGIMATSAITNTGVATMINGDVSLDPGTSNGLLPIQVNGAIHINDTVSEQARLDLLAAYNYYTTLPPGVTIPGGADLGGLYPTSIPPGTYTSGSTMLVSTNIILDGAGNTNAIWVFQIGSSLTTTANVSLVNGAQAKNIFWVCVQDGTVGVGSTFNGTIISGRDVTLKTGATVNGRILAGATTDGTIALDTNTVNVPAP